MKAIYKTRLKWLFWLLVMSIVANHIAYVDHFPGNPNYRFPFYNILGTLSRAIMVVFIAEMNLRWFKRHFSQVAFIFSVIVRYLLSTMLYIILVYILLLLIRIYLLKEHITLHNIAMDFGVTMLVSALIIITISSKSLLDLYSGKSIVTDSLDQEDVEQDKDTGPSTPNQLIPDYTDIAYFYSKGKIVFIAKTDGSSLPTAYVLTQIESEAVNHAFFRANRQMLLPSRSIDHYEKIENGKLSVYLLSSIAQEGHSNFIVSRYKRTEFINWYNGKF